MATKAETADTCPVCFETRPLKIVGRCKHSFCEECLLSFIGKQGDDVFSCPTCKVDCPRPSDGVKGLVDFTGEDIAAEDLEALLEDENIRMEDPEPRMENAKRTQNPEVFNCIICLHKKQVVQAINICAECNCLHICKDCTEVHGRNEATADHFVVEIQGAMCETHPNSMLSKYCQNCKLAVCVVCVMLEHGDHKVDKIQDLVDVKVPELKACFEEKQKQLKELETLEANLCLLKDIAPTVDKSAMLIKEVQNYAEERIQKIIKWKDDIINRIEEDYKVIKDIPIGYETVSKEVKCLQALVKQAAGLLDEAQHNFAYLENVVAAQHDLEAVIDVGNDFKGYEKELRELHEHNNTFTPQHAPRDSASGNIDKTKKQTDPKQFLKDKIFEHTIQVDSKDKFIPCVASLGKKFAVAHPVENGQPSTAINIYELSGNLTITLRDNVPPLHDMSATPDGLLAVLSDGTSANTCSVKLFDLETGYISTTPDIENVKPLSLGVTLKHQYAILGDNSHGQKQIVVVNKDGTSEIRHTIDEQDFENPQSLTCGGKHIFVGGEKFVYPFGIKNTTILRRAAAFHFINPAQSVSISATVWDDIYYACVQSRFAVGKFVVDKENKDKWLNESECILLSDTSGADREVNISTSDGQIVMSHGQTIKVFKV